MGAGLSKVREENARANGEDFKSLEIAMREEGDELKFTEEQFPSLRTIYDRFKGKYDKNNKIDMKDFLETFGMAEKTGKKVADFVFNLEEENNEFPTFGDFIKRLNCFHPKRDYDKACKTVFDLYKDKKKETISFDGLEKIVSCSLDGSELMSYPEPKLKILVNQLISEFNDDGDDQIQLSEFNKMVDKAKGIIGSMQLNLDVLFQDT